MTPKKGVKTPPKNRLFWGVRGGPPRDPEKVRKSRKSAKKCEKVEKVPKNALFDPFWGVISAYFPIQNPKKCHFLTLIPVHTPPKLSQGRSF